MQTYSVEDLLADESFTDYCLNGHSTHRHKWNGLISSNPSIAIAAAEAKKLLTVLSPSLLNSEIAVEVNKVREALGMQPVTEPRKKSKTSVYSFTVIILVLLIAAGGYFLSTTKNKPVASLSQFTTKTGERKQFILPDGSTVILNSNSSFSFDKSFGVNTREINLEGAAFFKVSKNASKPFIVKSNGFSTTAVGTAFYVTSGSTTDDFRVDLLEGKVKLEKNTSHEVLFLDPGEKASWKSDKKFERQVYDTVSLNKWVKGVLSFNNSQVDDVFSQLEAWYAVQIVDRRTNPEVISITGDYVNVPLEDVLKIICFSLSCTYQIDGDKIIIQ